MIAAEAVGFSGPRRSRKLDCRYGDREAERPREITLRPGVGWCFREAGWLPVVSKE